MPLDDGSTPIPRIPPVRRSLLPALDSAAELDQCWFSALSCGPLTADVSPNNSPRRAAPASRLPPTLVFEVFTPVGWVDANDSLATAAAPSTAAPDNAPPAAAAAGPGAAAAAADLARMLAAGWEAVCNNAAMGAS